MAHDAERHADAASAKAIAEGADIQRVPAPYAYSLLNVTPPEVAALSILERGPFAGLSVMDDRVTDEYLKKILDRPPRDMPPAIWESVRTAWHVRRGALKMNVTPAPYDPQVMPSPYGQAATSSSNGHGRVMPATSAPAHGGVIMPCGHPSTDVQPVEGRRLPVCVSCERLKVFVFTVLRECEKVGVHEGTLEKLEPALRAAAEAFEAETRGLPR